MIMDGNRRWARRRSLQPWEGHAVGFDKVIEVASWVEHLGVEELTLWMLSTDNLKRSTEEIAALVPIICRAIDKLVDTNRFTIRHVGNRDVLPEPLHSAVLQLPHAGIGRTTVNLAIGYGGLDEIERGVRQYLREHGDTATALEHLNVAAIEAAMGFRPSTPDLIIRTSGERRLSGFFLWNSGGSRFHVVERHWPDFTFDDLFSALMQPQATSIAKR